MKKYQYKYNYMRYSYILIIFMYLIYLAIEDILGTNIVRFQRDFPALCALFDRSY